MNPKISKLREELEKTRAKIAVLQERSRELEKQIRELENTDIIGLVRAEGYTLEQFAELLKMLRDNSVAAAPVRKEEADHEAE